MSLLTCVYGRVSHHILHEEEKNRRRNNALAYDPKEDKFLLYCPLYVKSTWKSKQKHPWPRVLSTESVTENKVRGFLFYQAHRAKRKQGGGLKAGESKMSTRNFDTKDCAALIRRSLTGTTELVENHNRSQFLGYSQLNQYLCACLELLKKKRYVGQSVISMEMIKLKKSIQYLLTNFLVMHICNRIYSAVNLQQRDTRS